jgi:P27 family predicted phage terminase small subunit
MKGRKPKALELRLIDGSRNVSPPSAQALAAADTIDSPPAWFSTTQSALWAHYIEHAPLGLLRTLDRELLTVWTVAADLHAMATQQINKYGMLVKSPINNNPMPSPYLRIIDRQAEIMMRASSELGFSPTGRARSTLAAGGKKDTNRFANNGFNRRA